MPTYHVAINYTLSDAVEADSEEDAVDILREIIEAELNRLDIEHDMQDGEADEI